MRIDFFFLLKQGRRHQISPYQIYVYYEKEKKKKKDPIKYMCIMK